jgi:protein involved in polysaccharide export with SLBB domain
VEISMASLRESINPAEDIVLKPFDVIRVERAEMVYVAGDVSHIGGFELQDKESMSVLQALIMAGGFGKSANHKQMLILRPVSNTSLRAKVALDYDRILKGEANDQPLFPNDILYVPTNSFNSKSFAGDLRVALPTALGLVSLIISLTR